MTAPRPPDNLPMAGKYGLRRDATGLLVAITRGGWDVVHLNPSTRTTEGAERLVDALNQAATPAPRPPGGGELLAARVELELELEQLFIDSERGIGESAGTQAERAMKLLVEFTGSDWLCRACGAVNGGQRDDDYRPNPSAGELPASSLRELPAKWRARRDRAAANPTQGNAGAGLAWESAAAQLEAALAEEPAPPAPAEVEAAVEEIAGCRCTDYEVAAGHNPRCTGQLADEILAALDHIRWADTLQAGRLRASLVRAEAKSRDYGAGPIADGDDYAETTGCIACGEILFDHDAREGETAYGKHAEDCPFAALAAPPPDGWEELAELVAAARPFAEAVTAFETDAAALPDDTEEVYGDALGDALTFGQWRRLRTALAALPGLGEGRG